MEVSLLQSSAANVSSISLSAAHLSTSLLSTPTPPTTQSSASQQSVSSALLFPASARNKRKWDSDNVTTGCQQSLDSANTYFAAKMQNSNGRFLPDTAFDKLVVADISA